MNCLVQQLKNVEKERKKATEFHQITRSQRTRNVSFSTKKRRRRQEFSSSVVLSLLSLLDVLSFCSRQAKSKIFCSAISLLLEDKHKVA